MILPHNAVPQGTAWCIKIMIKSHLSCVLVPILHRILHLHQLSRLVDHHAAERCRALRDLQTRQFADLCSREAVDRVCADFERQLSAVQHLLTERVGLFLQISLCSVYDENCGGRYLI